MIGFTDHEQYYVISGNVLSFAKQCLGICFEVCRLSIDQPAVFFIVYGYCHV
jgi:hypothetical protein